MLYWHSRLSTISFLDIGRERRRKLNKDRELVQQDFEELVNKVEDIKRDVVYGAKRNKEDYGALTRKMGNIENRVQQLQLDQSLHNMVTVVPQDSQNFEQHLKTSKRKLQEEEMGDRKCLDMVTQELLSCKAKLNEIDVQFAHMLDLLNMTQSGKFFI